MDDHHDVSTLSPSFELCRMLMSGWIPQAIHAAAELRIADELASLPTSSEELAKRVGTDLDATQRLLRALTLLGLVSEAEDGTFTLTPLGEPLRAEAPDSVRSLALFMGGRSMWRALGRLAACVRTGVEAWHLDDDSAPTFKIMDEHEWPICNQAMFAQSRHIAPAIASAYDFSRCTTVVDVGGGYGTLLAAILDAHPSTRGIVFDQPHARAGAEELIADRGLQERAEFVAGDFFTAVPSAAVPSGADAYVIKSVIHDWGDERCITILRNCRSAMAEGGRILVVEPIVPERWHVGDSPFDEMWVAGDLVLLNSGGRMRTEAEHRALFTAAGLRLERILPISGAMPIMELVPE